MDPMQRPTHRLPRSAAFIVLVFFLLPLAPASGGVDRKAPSMPGNVRIIGTTAGTVSLAWDASKDNKGSTQLVGYGLYRSRILIGTTTETSSTFSGLSCGTTYTFGIDAVDAAANRSQIAEITATTNACPSASSPPPST